MRFWIFVLIVVYVVVYFKIMNNPPQNYFQNVNYNEPAHDSMMNVIKTECDEIVTVESKGKNGYVFFTEPTYVSYIVLCEDGSHIRSFSIDEFYDGEWISLYRGEKVHPNHVVKIKKTVNNKIRLNVIRSYKFPRIKSITLYVERDI